MRWFLLVLSLLFTAPALADEQGQFLTKALASLQHQRNTAMDDAVNARAQAAVLADQLKLQQAVIDELGAWIEAAKVKLAPAGGDTPK